MRVAVDIDGVLTEFPAPLAWAANEKYGLSLPDSVFVDSAGFGISDEIRAWVYSDDGPASRLEPARSAVKFLKQLIDLVGSENVCIITARPEASRQMTEDWLSSHGLSGCEIIFDERKVDRARLAGVTHAIEDSARHARDYDAAGIRSILLAEQDASGLPSSICQLRDLDAAIRSLSAS
ncbi:MAG: hypothetical protein R3A46_13045 [Thermomicrobiales bacterium]